MRDVAVVAFSHHEEPTFSGSPTCVEHLVPAFASLWEQTGLTKDDVGFWCSGSSDYLAGRSFSFVAAVDAIGAYPPVNESHVEMDAAWALYEAWVKIQTGEVDTAVAFGFGKASAGQLRRVLALQLDPYTVAPLWPDSVSLAALQATAGLSATAFTYEEMTDVVVRSRPDLTRDDVTDSPLIADPLRRADCAPADDGVAAVMLVADDQARDICENPAWITGFDHRIDPHHLGCRNLALSPSSTAAARGAGLTPTADGVDVAELHAPFSSQELILRTALGLSNAVRINPSGGALRSNPMFASGLIRIGHAAQQIWSGSAQKVIGHATSGPALQQNLVCVMEGRDR